MKFKKKSIMLSTVMASLMTATSAHAVPPSQWMSGQWGVGFRINADNKVNIANYNVNTLVSQIQTIGNVPYVIVNLSDAAHGDAYLAPHSVLTAITPGSTPDSDRDLFQELLDGFQGAGIKVIAYAATQGPAMLKHGAEKAFDAVEESPGVWTSEGMDNWATWVLANYGATDDETYKTAYAEVIIEEYAQRYGAQIDGWWFDHASLSNRPLLHNIVTAANPNVAVTFNYGQKIPLKNNNPDYEDYTFGHPTPVAQAPASDALNLPMLQSIEATPDGFFDDAGRKSLGHMFMPMGQTWNSGVVSWTLDQAADWQERATKAGGAWSWNVKSDDSNSGLDSTYVSFMKDVLTQIAVANTAPVFTVTPILKSDATEAVAYSGTIAGSATDVDSDPLTYAKIAGPAWLSVADDGTLSGSPTYLDDGLNIFTVEALDGKGNVAITTLELTVNITSNGYDTTIRFDDLRGNLSAGSIDGLKATDTNVSITKIADGSDVVYSFAYTGQNFDGIGVLNDSLSWDLRVSGFTNRTYNVNGNDSSVTGGTSGVQIETADNEFSVTGGPTVNRLDDAESIQFSIENIVVTAAADTTVAFDGFDALWHTGGTFIYGEGTSGLESVVNAASGVLALTPASVLTVTATANGDRVREISGAFTVSFTAVSSNTAPVFTIDPFTKANGSQDLAYSGNIASSATDADLDPLTFAKISGPAWLTVASDGSITGTPSAADIGLNSFMVEVSDGTDVDTATMDIVVDEAAASGLLFGDDFESGDLTTGGWTGSGSSASVSGAAAYTGSYGIELPKSGNIVKTISTVGYATITVSYDRRAINLDGSEKFRFQWSTDGSSWNTEESINTTAYASVSFVLPASAGEQAGLQLRFKTNGSNNDEYAYLDNVVVTGE